MKTRITSAFKWVTVEKHLRHLNEKESFSDTVTNIEQCVSGLEREERNMLQLLTDTYAYTCKYVYTIIYIYVSIYDAALFGAGVNRRYNRNI